MQNYIVLSIIVLLLASCYEKEEGCLDIRAKDYDFAADEACEDCCTFPNMKLSVTHLWGDTTLMTDSIYTLGNAQKIRILSSKFYLSEIVLVEGSSSETILEDLVVQGEDGITRSIPHNFAFVQNSRFSYTIGSFDQARNYDGLSMKFGVDDKFLADEFVEDDEFFDDETLTFTNFRMSYILEADTLSYSLIGPQNTLEIDIVKYLELPIGVDFTIPLVVNYDDLLKNIDLNSLATGSSDQAILANITDFFGL